MDKLLAELLGTVAAPLIEALNRNSDNLERVIAGQEAAMAKLEGATGGIAARAPRKTKAEKDAEAAAATTDTPSTSTPAAAEEPVAAPTPEPAHPLLAAPNGETKKNGKGEDEPTANYRASDFSRDQVKNEFIGWLGETTDADARKERAGFVGAIGQHFGVTKPFDPTNGLPGDDARKQTLFFLRRKRDGLPVNFSQDYDFDLHHADPAHGAEEEEIDPLG